MAVLNVSIGANNYTTYVIVRAIKNTDLGSDSPPERARAVFTPEDLQVSINFVLPEVGEIPSGVYTIETWKSSDGVTLDQKVSSVINKAVNRIPISETFFYQVGGGRSIDPAPGQTQLIDPYLDGKDLQSVTKEGFRPLIPPDYEGLTPEYSRATGGVIELQQGLVFNTGEVYVIVVTYAKDLLDDRSTGGLYDGVVLVPVNTTLIAEHRNRRIKAEGTGSTLQIVLEDINNVPEGTYYHFSMNGGNNVSTRIKPFSGTIKYMGVDYAEMGIRQGESLRIEKYGSYWEIINPPAGLSQVGEIVTRHGRTAIDLLPADGKLYNVDDEPRLYNYILNLPAENKISSSSVSGNTFQYPVDAIGKFGIDTGGKNFRVPDLTGLMVKALNDFDGSTPDLNRPVNSPGGIEVGKVGHFTTDQLKAGTMAHGGNSTGKSGPVWLLVNRGDDDKSQGDVQDVVITNGVPTDKNTVDNVGFVYFVRA